MLNRAMRSSIEFSGLKNDIFDSSVEISVELGFLVVISVCILMRFRKIVYVDVIEIVDHDVSI